MPLLSNRWMTRFLMTDPFAPAFTVRPLAPLVFTPFSTMMGFWLTGSNPGWVDPSIVTVSVIAGRAVVRLMAFDPVPIANVIVSGTPGVPLALLIAARSVPGPLLAAEVTGMIAGASRSSRPSTRGRNVDDRDD